MLMDTAIRDFGLYLEAERGYSTQTTKAYRSDLLLFCDYVRREGSSGLVGEITTPLVRAWVVEMKQRGLSLNTIGRRVHALRSFWRYLLDTGTVADDLLRKVSVPKRVQAPPRYLQAGELRALLQAAQDHRPAGAATGRGAEGVREPHALSRKSIEVGRLDDGIAIAAESFDPMIVGDDQHDVGPFVFACQCSFRDKR